MESAPDSPAEKRLEELSTTELQALSEDDSAALETLLRRRIKHMHDELEVETFLSWHRGQELVTRSGATAAIELMQESLESPEAQVRVVGNWVEYLTNRNEVDWRSIAELTHFQHSVAAAENNTSIG